MDVFPLGPGFAAELRRIDLIHVVSCDCANRVVREAFEEHSWPPSSRSGSYPIGLPGTGCPANRRKNYATSSSSSAR